MAILNRMFLDDSVYPNRTKTNKQTLIDASNACLFATIILNNPSMLILGHNECRISTLSQDTRGRAQKSIRFYFNEDDKIRKNNYRPWHVVWIATNESIIENTTLQYSHRCHNENCCESTHGIWETDEQNKNRNRCRNCSHLILPDGTIIQLCPHEPFCLTPIRLESWDDGRITSVGNQIINFLTINNDDEKEKEE